MLSVYSKKRPCRSNTFGGDLVKNAEWRSGAVLNVALTQWARYVSKYLLFILENIWYKIKLTCRVESLSGIP